MVTKLKRIRYHSLWKGLIFLLIALLLTLAFIVLNIMAFDNIPLELIIEPDYSNSTQRLTMEQSQWYDLRVQALELTRIFSASILAALIFLIYLTRIVGRTKNEGELVLTWHDRIPSDLLIVAYTAITPVWLSAMGSIYGNRLVTLTLSGLATFLFICALGFCYLSLVKQLKAKTFIRKSMWFRVTYGIYDFMKSLFDGRAFRSNRLTKSLFKRQMLFILVSALLVVLTIPFLMIPPLMFLPILMELFVIYWFVKGNRKTFKEIDQGFNDSLEDQMKAERMKIQLVTNVSHDLKTPLTSIIGYVDLLSKEPLEAPAREYVSILAEKSDRLKHIVSDLFDLAKSSTGNIQVDIDLIDLKKLIQQTLGDLSDEIEKSGLEVKVQVPENPVEIQSDGQKLYRVLINLLDNALKYSLKGTRIYVTLELANSLARVSIKNIAGYEMTFTKEEVLQRFTRGDQSRSSEGSGLGLSIAESFTNVCGGDFELVIDGDLFKVNITLPIKV